MKHIHDNNLFVFIQIKPATDFGLNWYNKSIIVASSPTKTRQKRPIKQFKTEEIR